jgi:hypothetical protein
LVLQKLTTFVKNEKARHKNSIDKDIKDLEKKHKMKLSEEARNDLIKWFFDVEITREQTEAAPPKIEVKEEKKKEGRSQS